MIYRNLLCSKEEDIQTILNESGPKLLNNLEDKLSSNHESLVVHSLYVLSSIASGS